MENGARLGDSNALHAAAGNANVEDTSRLQMEYLLNHGAEIDAIDYANKPYETCDRATIWSHIS
jgi:hypothetical protein